MGAKTENCFMLVHPKKATKLDVKRDSLFLIFSKLMRRLPLTYINLFQKLYLNIYNDKNKLNLFILTTNLNDFNKLIIDSLNADRRIRINGITFELCG